MVETVNVPLQKFHHQLLVFQIWWSCPPRLLDTSELHRFKPSQLSPLGEALLKIKTLGQGEVNIRSMQIWG